MVPPVGSGLTLLGLPPVEEGALTPVTDPVTRPVTPSVTSESPGLVTVAARGRAEPASPADGKVWE